MTSFYLKQLPGQSIASPLKICVVGNPGSRKTEFLMLLNEYLNWKCYCAPVFMSTKKSKGRESNSDETTTPTRFDIQCAILQEYSVIWNQMQCDYQSRLAAIELGEWTQALSVEAFVIESILDTHEVYDKVCLKKDLLSAVEYNILSEKYNELGLPTLDNFNMVIHFQNEPPQNLYPPLRLLDQRQQQQQQQQQQPCSRIDNNSNDGGNGKEREEQTTTSYSAGSESVAIDIFQSDDYIRTMEACRHSWLANKTNVFVVDARRRNPLQILGILTGLLGVSSNLPREIQWYSGIRTLKDVSQLRTGDGYLAVGCKSYYGMVKLPFHLEKKVKDESDDFGAVLRQNRQQQQQQRQQQQQQQCNSTTNSNDEDGRSSFDMMLRLIWHEHTERRSVLTLDEYCDKIFDGSPYAKRLAENRIGESFIIK